MNRLILCILTLLAFNLKGQSQKVLIDSLSLEQVVISATRASNEDPVTFQNIISADIEKLHVGQDPVVLIQELSPSIVSYSDGGTDIGNYSQLRMRGIDQSRINMTLNGVPLNDMADHGTYFSNFSDFGNSMESIQVLRGAGSTQRGVASYGGAINFESTNVFTSEAMAEAQLTIGSFGTLRTAAEVATSQYQNGIGFYGRLTRTKTGGYKVNSGSDSYSLFFSGGKITDSQMLKVTAFSGKTQNGQSYLNVPLSEIEKNPRTNYNDINDIDDFEQNMVQIQYAKYASNETTIQATAYYNGAGGVFPFSFGGDQFMFGLENDHYGAMVNVDKGLKTGKLNFGAHSYIFNRTNFEYITPLVTEPYTRDFTDKVEFNAFANYTLSIDKTSFYANAEMRALSMKMKSDLSFGPGINNENNWLFLNGMVGVNVNLSNKSSAYFSLAYTNREPTRSDILNGVENSESVLDAELGWKIKASKFSLDANLFHMSFKNEISNIGALEALSYMEIRQNVDKSTRYGVEASFQYSPNDDLRATLNLAWMETNILEYDNGNSTFSNVNHIFVPNWIIQPSISYALSKGVSFRLSSRYVSSSFSELSNNKEFVLPSHFVMNSQLDFKMSKSISASLILNNIFNRLYFTEGGPIDVDFDGIVDEMGFRIQPPRHFYIMLKYSL